MKLSSILSVLVFLVLTLNTVISTANKTNYDKIIKEFPDLQEKRNKAIAWTLSQRDDDSGWVDTVGVITALQLTNDTDWNIPNTERELSIKQMSLEIFVGLNKNDPDNPLTAGTVAKYANGIMSTCKDPKNYHGYDLITKLKGMEARYPFETSYQALALCNAGVKLPSSVTEKLLKIIKENGDPLFPQDTTAITIMALTCINKQNGISDDLLHSNVRNLSHTQKTDGSFGNIYSSSIVVEALLPFLDANFSWDAVQAAKFLLNQQKKDGSFGNLGATISVLPFLSGHSLVNLPDLQCKHSKKTARSNEINPTKITDPGIPGSVNISYSIWIGDEVNEAYTIALLASPKTSMYELMLLAADQNKIFRFTADNTVYGHFVTSINGVKNNVKENMYWMFGTLQDEQSKDIKMADKGVDEFYPEDNDHMVFWYKRYGY